MQSVTRVRCSFGLLNCSEIIALCDSCANHEHRGTWGASDASRNISTQEKYLSMCQQGVAILKRCWVGMSDVTLRGWNELSVESGWGWDRTIANDSEWGENARASRVYYDMFYTIRGCKQRCDNCSSDVRSSLGQVWFDDLMISAAWIHIHDGKANCNTCGWVWRQWVTGIPVKLLRAVFRGAPYNTEDHW